MYQKHEWFFVNMVPISISKHETTCLVICFFNFGIILSGLKQSSFPRVLMKTEFKFMFFLLERGAFRKSHKSKKEDM